jgi:hypothetical protein
VCRHHTGKHAHRAAGVAAVERTRRGTQPADPATVDHDHRGVARIRRALDGGAQRSQAFEGGCAVGTGRVVTKSCAAIGNGGKKCVTM